jgi:hypothetical protein
MNKRYAAAVDAAMSELDKAAENNTIEATDAQVRTADAYVRLACEIRSGAYEDLLDENEGVEAVVDLEPAMGPEAFARLDPASFVDLAGCEPTSGGGTVCPVPGCEIEGSHLHKAWELAAAQGRLTAEAVAEWDGDTWLLFLHAHGIQQSEALDAVRARAEAAGWAKPWSLSALAGRPQLCEVLLDLAKERKA